VLSVAFNPENLPNGVRSATMTLTTSDPAAPAYVFSPIMGRRSRPALFQAHHPLDETAGTTLTDISGQNAAGALQVREPVQFGQPPLVTSGTSLGLLPANSSIIGNYITSPVVHFPSFTFSGWFKPEASTANRTLFNRDPDFAGGDKIYGLVLTPAGNLRLRIRNTIIIESGDGVIADGTAYHIVVTHKDNDGFGNDTATRTRLYVNGVLLVEKSGADTKGFDDYPFSAPVTQLHIGSRTAAGSGYRGLIDDLQLYSYEIPDWQVLRLFSNAGRNLDQLPEYRFEITRANYNAAQRRMDLEWTSHPNRIYAISTSSDLVRWDDLTDSHPSGGELTTYSELSIDPAATRRFYRITTREP